MADDAYPTQHDEFLMWVGFCITAWARVEEHLFKICEKCLGARIDRVAIVYYRTPTLDARIQLLDELVRSTLPKKEKKSGAHDHPALKEWDALRKDIKALLSTRRRIAHHPVKARTEMGIAVPTSLGILDAKSWLEIYISEAERLRPGSEDIKPLKRDDLVQHCHEVHAISTRAANFLRKTLPKHV